MSMYKIENSSISGGVPNPVFMQDNSLIHNLYCALTWFQEAGLEVTDHLAALQTLILFGVNSRLFSTKGPQPCLFSGEQVTVKKRIAECLGEVAWLAWKKHGRSMEKDSY